MTTNEMISLVDRFLDSKGLAAPGIRKNAIRKMARYFEETGSFMQGKQLALPSDKTVVKEAYGRYKGSDLSGAESSAINHMYEVVGKAVRLSSNKPSLEPKAAPMVKKPVDLPLRKDAPERMLIEGKFVAASEVTESMVPDVPGLYCMKLRKSVALPAKYGKVAENGIIYIGQASKSLRKRFWEQELNHKSAATFFRSIGAMLGYLPPKGSLAGKSTRNYKFSPEDTEAIKKWMRQSLLVNWIPFDTETMDTAERILIVKYKPLVNIEHNPQASEELKAARQKCVDYAQNK